MQKLPFPLISWSALAFFLACHSGHKDNTATSNEPQRFELLPADQTGIQFVNHLEERADLNIFTYLYLYNGAGVSAGDVNGDGLCDLYFTSNQDKCRLYLNRGGFKFEDVTEQAGVAGEFGWTTGVTMVDVNGDQKLDIYVSRVNHKEILRGHNLLYINRGAGPDGIPVFTEEAKRWGLDLEGYSTQAAFFDYDLDGDLDMFWLNHSTHNNGTFGTVTDLRYKPHPTAGDRLLRNDGERFTDVTAKAGIYSSVIGYGLGISTGDVNLDGWPDIYIGNDFHENDYLYLNNGNGSFTEVLESCMGHTSRFSMGTDVADFNNDGLPDVISLDMLPADPEILKSSASEDPMDIFEFKLSYGYNHQYARNNLQLNAGIFPQLKGPQKPVFSETACYSGVYATDWSWSALFCDLDLDGWKDLYVSNGIYRRSNDLDYIKFIEADSVQARIHSDVIADKDLLMVQMMPQIKLANYAYRNKGDLTFEDVSKAWGMTQASYSNGTAYADLDNDGDLDLVVNNLEDPAFVYKNLTFDPQKPVSQDRQYLRCAFAGEGKNSFGIGARVFFDLPQGRQYQENFPTRGYQSSVEPILTFGLGVASTIDSLTVVWPNGTFQVLRQVSAGQTLTLRQSDAQGKFDWKQLLPAASVPRLFAEIQSPLETDWRHRENKFVEFSRERLIPNMNSTEGPRLAVGDVNGDGLEDFFVGGAKWQPGALWLQNPSGTFSAVQSPALVQDSTCEDVGAVFFDADGDRDLDLAVVSGGNEFREGQAPLQPRLYLNDGRGGLTRAADAFSGLSFNGSCVAPADFDGDGDIDLFMGGRTVPWSYGVVPRSYLLENDGKGKFRDVSAGRAPGLEFAGLVKAAVWTDLDGDRVVDLALIGDWMPLRIFLNKNGRLEALSPEKSGLAGTSGWWNCLQAADLDGDGDQDLVAGNYGLNTRLSASREHPVTMYVRDFDNNQSLDQLLSYYYQGREILFATKDELQAQVPSIKKKFLKYHDYAKAGVKDIFGNKALESAEKLQAFTFESAWFENKGDGTFERHALPAAVQLSVVEQIMVQDFNADGRADLLLVGNFYEANPELGRYDASYGALLLGDGKGNFQVLNNMSSGLLLRGQCRDVQTINTPRGPLLLIARNNERLGFYLFNQAGQQTPVQ